MYSVKSEGGRGICRGCLSSDRRLSSLTNRELYFTLLNEKETTSYNLDLMFCWECSALMRRMQMFQSQAQEADKMFAESLGISLVRGSLSRLSICHKKDYDVTIEESYYTLAKELDINDIKQENSDDVEFNEQQFKDINVYNSGSDEGRVYEDDNQFVTKMDLSSDEETTKRGITSKKHVKLKKREFEEVCVIPIEFKVNQLPERKSTRIQKNRLKQTCKRLRSDKVVSKKKVKRKYIKKNTDIELVVDHVNDVEDTDLNKLDENEVNKDQFRNNSGEHEYIDESDKKGKESNDILERSDKSEDSNSDDNDPNLSDFSDTLIHKEDKPKRKYVKRRKKEKSLQTVKLNYSHNDLNEYFEKVEVSDEMIEEVLRNEPKYTTAERPIACEYCGLCFEFTKHMIRHVSTRHKQIRRAMRCTDYRYCMYRCTVCDKILREEHTDAHMKYLHRAKYVCIECDGVFWDKAAGEEHCKTSHKQFVCKICNVVKTKRKYLNNHMETWHLPCKCEDCGREFPKKKDLRSHRDLQHPSESKPELRYCVQCDIQFSSVFKYQSHLRYTKSHRTEAYEKFPCSACGKELMTKFALECHFDRFHRGTTRFQCPHCGKYFARKNGLNNHIESLHLKVVKPKNKICSYCGRAFSTNRVLTHHIRTHTGERPYSCQHCPAAFAQKFPLRKHLATVHKNITESARHVIPEIADRVT